MKTTIPVTTVPIHLALLTALAMVASSTSAKLNGSKPIIPESDSIFVQKQITSKKSNIRLYPDVNHQVLFFSANGEENKHYQLFLFDIEGKLLKQVDIKNKQTTVINKIAKGTYLFEVFCDDVRIENGQVLVK
jgi:hypothetical protein